LILNQLLFLFVEIPNCFQTKPKRSR
jgi:hypothetical protein